MRRELYVVRIVRYGFKHAYILSFPAVSNNTAVIMPDNTTGLVADRELYDVLI